LKAWQLMPTTQSSTFSLSLPRMDAAPAGAVMVSCACQVENGPNISSGHRVYLAYCMIELFRHQGGPDMDLGQPCLCGAWPSRDVSEPGIRATAKSFMALPQNPRFVVCNAPV
jgi:hypothetical protein